jgi:UDP-N-acetylmuramoyl-L-alanyl-D-glutamate--2,6-diaminopimelate ligase
VHRLAVTGPRPDAVETSSSELRARFAAAHPRLTTAAVTGTNGKTTTTSMIDAVVAAAGEPSARLTTLGAWVAGVRIDAADATAEFLATVEAAVDHGVRTLALETTSKALAGGLARNWRPRVAVFTNLTRDHLDLHGSPEAYLAAKAQLFMALPPGGVAVLNRDDAASRLILQVTPRHARVVTYSVRDPGATLAAQQVVPRASGTRVTLAPSALADRLGGALALTVVGAVHAQNALAAALACDAMGYPAEAITAGLSGYRTVAGRFQLVAERPLVVVDYAHTPDGLQGTLTTARELVAAAGRDGRVVCVFGCGGGRDRGKRPQMGEVVDRLADRAVLTTDNPRFEEPAAIADDVLAGVPAPVARWQVELDRRAAIERAIAEAAPDDVVVIAGKGHEQVQEVRGVEHPFSDEAVAREAAARRGA